MSESKQGREVGGTVGKAAARLAAMKGPAFARGRAAGYEQGLEGVLAGELGTV